MTDRELLELAAKAAGIDVKYAPGGNADGRDVLRIVYKRDGYHDWLDREWNPLTDDGDALRLAVRLGLQIDQGKRRDGVPVAYVETAIDRCIEVHGEDPCAATRRAIVRTAAEIGKAMP